MKSSDRRFAETLASMAIGWLAAALIFALVKGEPIQLLPKESGFAVAIVGALLFGAGLRFIVDTVSARQHG